MYRRHVRARRRLYRRKIRRYVVHDILHADDPPHRLAMGVAIGFFVMCSPFFGLHMVLVVLLAWLLRANKLVGLPVVWLCNPLQVYICYLIGRALTGDEKLGLEWFDDFVHPKVSWGEMPRFYWARILHVARPLSVGGTIVGLAGGAIIYPIIYYAVRRYRIWRWGSLVRPGPTQ